MAENDDGTKPNTLATEKVIPPQDPTVQGSKRKEVSTVQMTVIRLTRKQLYDEIWEISAAGTAKKYDIPYSQFLKQIKEANIPIPPSGYWTKISFATVYKGNIIKNLIMDCQSYTKYRPNETTGGIFVSWRRKEELPTGA